MKPADQVISVGPKETIRAAMELMLFHKVGTVVVLASETVPGKTLLLLSAFLSLVVFNVGSHHFFSWNSYQNGPRQGLQ
jgi:hypothetical protein